MDLIMHRVTKESGLTDSANGSMAKDTEPLGSTTKGGRHVGLDKMCLLMEVRIDGVLRSWRQASAGGIMPAGKGNEVRRYRESCVRSSWSNRSSLPRRRSSLPCSRA